MAMLARNQFIGGTDVHFFKAYVFGRCFWEYPKKIWSQKWYVYVPPI